MDQNVKHVCAYPAIINLNVTNMKNPNTKKENAIIGAIVILWFLGTAFAIFLVTLLSGCQLTQAIEPDDWPIFHTDTIPDTPVDTITEPIIVIDTCEFLVPIDTPAFTLLSTQFFNGVPGFFEWHWDQDQTTYLSLVALMEAKFPQYDYTYYEENSAVALIIDGVFNNSLFQAKAWTNDAIGQKALLTAFGQTFYFWGALTFEEAMIEADKRPSVKSFHFTNTSWTVEENNRFARVCLNADLCKEGEYIARLVNAGIKPELVDSFHLFQWQFVLDLNDQLLAVK